MTGEDFDQATGDPVGRILTDVHAELRRIDGLVDNVTAGTVGRPTGFGR
ncbi:hypothetical protein ACQPW3_22300 [Actinosynnema sp. CA-248983]